MGIMVRTRQTVYVIQAGQVRHHTLFSVSAFETLLLKCIEFKNVILFVTHIHNLMNSYIDDPHHTGVGDFAWEAGIDCDISIAAVTALSYIDLIVASTCNVLIVRYLAVRLLDRSTSFCSSFNQARGILPYFFLVHGLGDVIFCLLNLYTHRNLELMPIVGTDISITIIACICPLSIFCGLTLYYVVIINFLKGYAVMMSPSSRDKVHSRFGNLLLASYSIPLGAFVGSAAPFVGLAHPGERKLTAQIYLIGIGLIAAIYGSLYALAFGFLLKEIRLHMLTSTMINHDIKLVLSRLRAAYYAGSMLFFTAFIAYFICGVSDYLLRKSSYVFLIIQIACHPFVTVLILTVSRISNANPKLSNRNNNIVAIHPDAGTEMWTKVSTVFYLFLCFLFLFFLFFLFLVFSFFFFLLLCLLFICRVE